ncbi:MAG: 30S ribosomal protein S1 [Spirochaetaceae bacterium]
MGDKDTHNAESVASDLQKELQDEFLKQLDELEEGQIVEGTVVQVGQDEVFVDIGYKAEGRIKLAEFEEPPQVGDNVQVVLLRRDIRNGGVPVSKRKADEKLFWRELKQAFQDRTPVEGTVARDIKGGFEVRLPGEIRGFNPISKMDVRRIEKPEEYVGLKSKFYVERLYSDNRVNIILSRRAWLEEEIEKNRQRFFENVDIGDEVEGIVKSFTSFGAFIDLGGFDGLLHINDMSWGHVTRPKDYVKKGEQVRLKVIKMDPEEKKINLSLRHMTEDPWESFEDHFAVEQVVQGTVTKLTDFGAFIELAEGIEGLAHISEMSWIKRVNHPSEVVNVGDKVEAMILDYNIQEGKVSLGLKQVMPNPWDEIDEKYPVGMRLKKPIKKITNTGAFVELEEGIDGFLHVDDLSWTKRYKNPGAVLTEGEEVECVVIMSDPENHNVRLGVKQLEDDPWQQLRAAYPNGSIIDGEITNITDFGLFVRVQGGIEGLINKANLSERNEPFEQAVQKYNVGDKIRAVVTEVSPQRQRLSLSVRDLERQEQRQELEKYIHEDDSATDTFSLGEILKEDSQEE